uniref:Uncharacterized protein n=1 Tax=viral metagenome TaxID=1070528 RepID=A0A6M3JTH5_9ZZZZ
MDDGAFNAHWIDDKCCRDYKIGNIILRDVPDDLVLRHTKFRGLYGGYGGLATGNVLEFMESCYIEASVLTITRRED